MTNADLPQIEGFVAEGGSDWGYLIVKGRRKVLLWSRWPLKQVRNDLIGEPGGRHVAATIETPAGSVRVHGVCVPWRDAHVRTGRKDRGAWQDHRAFLEALRELPFSERADPALGDLPVIVAGDTNQSLGRYAYGNDRVRENWHRTLAVRSISPVTDEGVIDKIAVGPQFQAGDSRVWPKALATGERLSDHYAVSCPVRLTG